MGCESRSRFADRVITAQAGRQYGVVARAQLLQAGITPRAIQRRLEAGRLIELHRGVYLAGAIAPDHANEMAALLACGEIPSVRLHGQGISFSHPQPPKALLSHRSAANLWGLLPYPASSDVCITTRHGRGATRRRIRAVRARLERRDIRRRNRMPLTSPPRTILDLTAELAGGAKPDTRDPLRASCLDDLEQLIAQAQYRRLASEAELRGPARS